MKAARRAFILTVPIQLVAVGMHVTNAIAFDTHLLTFSGEYTIPAILSASLMLAAAGAAAYAGSRDEPHRVAWFGIGALMLLLGAEELVLHIHENVERELLPQRIVLVLEVAFGLLVFGLLQGPIRNLPSPAPGLLLLAALMLVGSQVSALIASFTKGVGVIRNTLVLAEEWGEMLIAAFVIAAIAPTIVEYIGRRRARDPVAG